MNFLVLIKIALNFFQFWKFLTSILAQNSSFCLSKKRHHTRLGKIFEKFSNLKIWNFGQFGRPPRHKILGEIDPLGSISGEDKGGMGFPLALKNFLT